MAEEDISGGVRAAPRPSWYALVKERLHEFFVELVAHTTGALLLLGTFKAVEFAVSLMWAEGLIFFKGTRFQFPASYVFDAADLAILIVYSLSGLRALYKAYNSAGKKEHVDEPAH